MSDELSACAIQVACETLGYDDLSEVPATKMSELYDIAESLEG